MFAAHSIHVACRSLSSRSLARPVALSSVSRHQRFSTSPRRLAVEPSDFINNIKHTELFQKIADKPEALNALKNLATLVQDAGIDITSTVPPSHSQMFRLALNRKFIKGVKTLMAELKDAGIDLTSEVRAPQVANITSPLVPMRRML
ncbi:hypothetical protein OF83DRAFT_1052778 [Amylostereum chailletii]|nr:hypothetical protein OF83DRAFT_1052778 [Amylostereum chailletii]